MKLILKTSTFVALVFLMVFTGKLINALTFEKIRINDLLKEAEMKFAHFRDNLDPNKKSLVVIGTSTSMMSFSNTENTVEIKSYANLLGDQSNVLNLSSIKLHYASEANALISFAKEKLPENQIFVLENLNYVAPLEIYTKYSQYKALSGCLLTLAWKKDKNFCIQLINEFTSENLNWLKNPCLKKHDEALNLTFFLDKKERVQILTKVLKCNEDIFHDKSVPLELMDLFHFGHFEDLRESFRLAGYNFADFSEDDYTDKFSLDELHLINNFLEDTLNKNKFEKFIVIPTPARGANGLSELPVFKRDNDNLVLIEIYDEIEQMKKLKNLNFYDIFPDGSHSRTWVHEILKNKIMPNLSKSIRTNSNE